MAASTAAVGTDTEVVQSTAAPAERGSGSYRTCDPAVERPSSRARVSATITLAAPWRVAAIGAGTSEVQQHSVFMDNPAAWRTVLLRAWAVP